MNDEKPGQRSPEQPNDESIHGSRAEQPVENLQCSPGCDCKPKGLGTKAKIVICLVVVVAAGVVLARNFTSKAESETNMAQKSFAAKVPTPI